jgi:hypothetical protein
MSSIYVFQSGNPIYLPNGIRATGVDPKLPDSERSINRWFNTQAFAVQPAFTLRTLSVRVPRLMADAMNKLDVALFKQIAFKERVKLEFRAEAFNALNNVQLGDPSVNPSAGDYGRISYENSYPRELQMGIRLVF